MNEKSRVYLRYSLLQTDGTVSLEPVWILADIMQLSFCETLILVSETTFSRLGCRSVWKRGLNELAIGEINFHDRTYHLVVFTLVPAQKIDC